MLQIKKIARVSVNVIQTDENQRIDDRAAQPFDNK